jgi:hypothetical protein
MSSDLVIVDRTFIDSEFSDSANEIAEEICDFAIKAAKLAEDADSATDYAKIAIENATNENFKVETELTFDEDNLLNKFNLEAIEKAEKFLELENSESEYSASAAAEASVAHKQAEMIAMDYAFVASKLVKRYNAAKQSALELASAALLAAEAHRNAAECFENAKKSIEFAVVSEMAVLSDVKNNITL